MTLRAKLVIAVVAVASVMCVFLLGYFGPHAERSFIARSESLITKSSEAMRELARSDNENSQRILEDVIRHTADARRRALQDIPLSIYGGDVERIRRAIEQQDSARTVRLGENVRVLGRELQHRADLKIDGHVQNLTDDQRAISKVFGSDLRTSYLMLSGAMLATLILLLALGLDRSIVRPVYQLRNATRKVATGDLSVQIEKRSRDELGDLAGDFAAMVDRLRSSQNEIREKNEQLETRNSTLQQEVQRKTRHLEETLTNLQATQQKLNHTDKMASLGTLAGGIAHEFNNLIGGIRGCITDALDNETIVEHREPLEVALRATHRATSITEKLLRFAHPRIDGLEGSSLGDMVSEVIDLVGPQARRQGVRVDTRISSRLMVVVNQGEMHQVFLNLLTNALQAMPNGGVLTVDASRAGENVEVRVGDTGVGIAADQLARVFDPFYTSRIDSGNWARSGAGLGLSVSFGIVEAHGGVLAVESEPGRGSTFTITVPADGSWSDGG